MIKYKKRNELNYDNYTPEPYLIKPIKLIGLIMVKNQEKLILDTLNSINGICDSIIVVDTGSTDNTISQIQLYYPLVSIKHIEWQEDYGKMRNLCLNFVPDDSWVLFVDSDETLVNIDDYGDIPMFLNYLDCHFPNTDIICTLKQVQKSRSVFLRVERFIKKTRTLNYFGFVHEEPRSSINLLRFDLDLEIYNEGSEISEINKFNKTDRYCKLIKKNIEFEPQNPRWISLLNENIYNKNLIEYDDYMDLLKKNILIDTSAAISVKNIIQNDYIVYLLESYIIELIKSDSSKLAKEFIYVAKILFPNNTNFITLEHSLFLKNLEKKCSENIDSIISYVNSHDLSLLHEGSDGAEEGLTAIIVILLNILGRFDQAVDLYSSITDETVRSVLKHDIPYLKNINQ